MSLQIFNLVYHTTKRNYLVMINNTIDFQENIL